MSNWRFVVIAIVCFAATLVRSIENDEEYNLREKTLHRRAPRRCLSCSLDRIGALLNPRRTRQQPDSDYWYDTPSRPSNFLGSYEAPSRNFDDPVYRQNYQYMHPINQQLDQQLHYRSLSENPQLMNQPEKIILNQQHMYNQQQQLHPVFSSSIAKPMPVTVGEIRAPIQQQQEPAQYFSDMVTPAPRQVGQIPASNQQQQQYISAEMESPISPIRNQQLYHPGQNAQLPILEQILSQCGTSRAKIQEWLPSIIDEVMTMTQSRMPIMDNYPGSNTGNQQQINNQPQNPMNPVRYQISDWGYGVSGVNNNPSMLRQTSMTISNNNSLKPVAQAKNEPLQQEDINVSPNSYQTLVRVGREPEKIDQEKEIATLNHSADIETPPTEERESTLELNFEDSQTPIPTSDI